MTASSESSTTTVRPVKIGHTTCTADVVPTPPDDYRLCTPVHAMSSLTPGAAIHVFSIDGLSGVIERVTREFGRAYSPQAITQVVNEGRDQLDTTSPGALPEMTERLARQRLAHPDIDPA